MATTTTTSTVTAAFTVNRIHVLRAPYDRRLGVSIRSRSSHFNHVTRCSGRPDVRRAAVRCPTCLLLFSNNSQF